MGKPIYRHSIFSEKAFVENSWFPFKPGETSQFNILNLFEIDNSKLPPNKTHPFNFCETTVTRSKINGLPFSQALP
jgi:hypothetical protein